jgi:regulator of protease activity HflC (stomatin/prohibitin superfamily)
MGGIIVGSIIGVIVLILIAMSIYTVKQQTFAIIERFGKFSRVSSPGLHLRIPIAETIAGRVSVRIRELNVKISTKTEDNVFVDLLIAVQFFVNGRDKVWDAFYKLTNAQEQMESWIFDTVRAKVPTMSLDNVFEKKEDIAKDVEESLDDRLAEYGYSLVRALVNDIQPDKGVADAMNEINRQQRLREAAKFEGEAKKVLIVKEAEADAESKRLSGKGIADQRAAIVEGFRRSIEDLAGIKGIKPEDATTYVLMTQYYDMMSEVGRNSKTNTIMLPHTPGAVGNIREQIIASLQINDLTSEANKPV